MQLNTQPVEKPAPAGRGTIDLHSIFYTLQGEGPFTGRRSVFIRLAGCNLQCPGCDTEYTQGRQEVFPEEIIYRAIKAIPAHHTNRPPLIVITGGEPFRQDIFKLTTSFIAAGFPVQVETNGVLAPANGLATMVAAGVRIVVSPKTSRIHAAWGEYAFAFKYVLQEGNVLEEDLLPIQALMHKATPHVARPPAGFRGPIYVNPMDEKDPVRNQLNLELVSRAALRHGYTAGVQLHKYLNLE
jgi:7-carboxy-7-deazaguanine synthase